MSDGSNPMALAAALTGRTEQLCIGLEQGIAGTYELVTPVTAALAARRRRLPVARVQLHSGQKQATLNVIGARGAGRPEPDIPTIP